MDGYSAYWPSTTRNCLLGFSAFFLFSGLLAFSLFFFSFFFNLYFLEEQESDFIRTFLEAYKNYALKLDFVKIGRHFMSFLLDSSKFFKTSVY